VPVVVVVGTAVEVWEAVETADVERDSVLVVGAVEMSVVEVETAVAEVETAVGEVVGKVVAVEVWGGHVAGQRAAVTSSPSPPHLYASVVLVHGSTLSLRLLDLEVEGVNGDRSAAVKEQTRLED